MNLKFTVDSTTPGVTIYSLAGKVLTEMDLLDLTEQFERSENLSSNAVFDFNELEHLNSTGINFFIRTLTKLRVNNRELVLCQVAGNVKRLLEVSKLDTIFSVFDTKEDALNFFKN